MKFAFNENNVTTELDYGQLTISGDEQYGFRPYQLMVSAIASCSGSVFKRVLQKQRIDIENLSVRATVQRNEKEANRLEQIDLVFQVKGQHLDQEKLKKSLAISSKNCAMVRTVENSITINESIEIVQ